MKSIQYLTKWDDRFHFCFQVLMALSLFSTSSCAMGHRSVNSIFGQGNSLDWQNLAPVEVSIRPGEVAHFEFAIPQAVEGDLFCRNGVKVPTVAFVSKRHAFLSESYFSSLEPYHCYWKTENGRKIVVAKVRVFAKKFPSERLLVDRKRVSLSRENQLRVKRENQFKAKVYASSPAQALFDKAFELPILSEVTSIYGARRIFNDHKRTQHLGTDYRAAVGTPIRASNSGIVVIARSLFYTGETVMIDHGLGIFTLYGHLSELKVREGEPVARGQLVGLSGQSGRVTGPHLHWGVTVGGFAVEGDSLIEAGRQFL